MYRRIIASMGFLLVLSGCSDHLAELRKLDPVAGNFQSALASEYLAYAESEAEQGHNSNAQHFAEKGVRATRGEIVLPDTPPMDKKDLLKARSALLNVLTEDVKRVNAQGSARAQLLYDCWLSQEKDPKGELTPCADEFSSTLNEVQQIADLLVHGEEAKHMVKFARGSSKLTTRANITLRKIARHIRNITNYIVQIQAHEAGVNSMRTPLGAAREEIVRAALIRHDIAPNRIKEKYSENGSAVLLSSDTEATNMVEIIVRTYVVPGGRK